MIDQTNTIGRDLVGSLWEPVADWSVASWFDDHVRKLVPRFLRLQSYKVNKAFNDASTRAARARRAKYGDPVADKYNLDEAAKSARLAEDMADIAVRSYDRVWPMHLGTSNILKGNFPGVFDESYQKFIKSADPRFNSSRSFESREDFSNAVTFLREMARHSKKSIETANKVAPTPKTK